MCPMHPLLHDNPKDRAPIHGHAMIALGRQTRRPGRRAASVLATQMLVLTLSAAGAIAQAEPLKAKSPATPPMAVAGDWADAQAAFAEYDDRRGLALLERAALACDARAQLAWGLALRYGDKLFPGLAADPAAARIWLERAVAADRVGCNVEVPLVKRTMHGR